MTSATDYDTIADDYAPIADDLPGNKYWERPATISLLPKLAGLDVLDAGCGAGFYSDYAANAGARVVGYDPSEKMARYASQRLLGRAQIRHCTTEEITGLYDLIISGLVLHYVEDLAAEVKMLANLLKEGGELVVSLRHPFLSGGLVKSPVYWEPKDYPAQWEFGELRFWHRSMTDIVDAFLEAGLTLERLYEPRPTPELEHADPKLWIWSTRGPLFVLFRLRR